jgi:ubiquinone/menaquinone biosynthesis C-methylase UbiE
MIGLLRRESTMDRSKDNPEKHVSPQGIMDMASAFYDSCVLFTASDLGIFAKLSELGKADSETIADTCGLNKRATRLLLDACAALGVLLKEGSSYSNTPETEAFLVPGSPADLSRAIRYNRDVYAAWGKLAEFLKTGQPAEHPGIHLGKDPERTRTFVLSMHSRALGIGQAALPFLDVSRRKKLLDVGGGPGTYSMLIARRNPHIECTVLDLPEVVRVADELIQADKMQDRVKTLAGDYHTLIFPGNNEVVNFFGVLHQESADSILALLKKAYNAMVSGGIIYILDMMTDATRTRPKFSSLFAVNMALTAQHGWVFSDTDLESWLREAGFAEFACRPLPPPMPHWLASARKP